MTLYDRLLPQARELLQKKRKDFPATTTIVMEQLADEKFYHWTELPYSTVRMMYDRIFNTDYFEPIEEEEVRMLFQDYWDND